MRFRLMINKAIQVMFVLLSIMIVSCDGEGDDSEYEICGKNDPDWFISLIESLETDSTSFRNANVAEFEYNGESLFHVMNPLSSCLYCYVYDCDGNLVEWPSVDDFQDYEQNREYIAHLWP